jgi:hypothetical protein
MGIATKGVTVQRGIEMTNTQNERLLEAVESIASSLRQIKYYQEHQADFMNTGWGFVKDISSSLDYGIGGNLEESFENKMDELIDVIKCFASLPAMQTKPSDS